MEVPICLAVDTTYNWNHNDVALGAGELAIEKNDPGDAEYRYLLVGDGEPVGGNVARLRAGPDFIAGLLQALQSLGAAVKQNQTINTANMNQMEVRLRQKIEKQETFHDDTLTGKGIQENPLSVKVNYNLTVAGLVASAEMAADGIRSAYPLPDDFTFIRIVIVEINGLSQRAGEDYELDLDARTITFIEKPENGDVITLYHTAENKGEKDENYTQAN